jgi:Carboxypeptidase regulatory-like domain
MSALRASLLILLVIALAAASATTRAQAQRVEREPGVSGYVIAPDGTPVSGGIVVTQSDRVSTTTSIDRAGRFRFVPTRSGIHQLLVSVPGLTPYRVTVTVPPSRFLRLPVIRLAPATFFRVRLVSSAGEPITAPQLRRRSFDVSGQPIMDGLGDRISESADNDGTIMIGPLPRGIMTVAVDMPLFAQTRLPDLSFGGAATIVDGGTVVIQQPGGVVHVDVVDGTGAAVPEHEVYLEDAHPRSPLAFRPVRTNQQGRASFSQLAAGQYRVSTTALNRCANVVLTTSRVGGNVWQWSRRNTTRCRRPCDIPHHLAAWASEGPSDIRVAHRPTVTGTALSFDPVRVPRYDGLGRTCHAHEFPARTGAR